MFTGNALDQSKYLVFGKELINKHMWKNMHMCQVSIFMSILNTLLDENILDWSKLKQIADKILKSIWNGK